MNWEKIELSGDPVLLVGLRGKGSFEPYRINVDKDVHPALLGVGEQTLEWLGSQEAVPYTPYVAQEEGEYLTIPTATLLSEDDAGASDGALTQKQEVAAIVRMVSDCDEVDEMGAGQLIERLGSKAFYLQAICLQSASGRVGFITKSRSLQVMKRSLIPLGKSDKNDRLKKITFPELVLESDVHAVIAPEQIAVINRTQFQFLVSDTPLIASYVPQQVERITTEFAGRGIEISSSTQAALLTRARDSTRIAKRLESFAERIKVIDISRVSDGAGFEAQDLVPGDFVNQAGEIECELDRVPELLDALEGRFFDDPFTDEHRRADRFRKR